MSDRRRKLVMCVAWIQILAAIIVWFSIAFPISGAVETLYSAAEALLAHVEDASLNAALSPAAPVDTNSIANSMGADIMIQASGANMFSLAVPVLLSSVILVLTSRRFAPAPPTGPTTP